MTQADLDELRQQVRDLTTRISRLEESLMVRETSLPAREAWIETKSTNRLCG